MKKSQNLKPNELQKDEEWRKKDLASMSPLLDSECAPALLSNFHSLRGDKQNIS